MRVNFKKMVSFVLVSALCLTFVTPVQAQANLFTGQTITLSDYLTEEDLTFFKDLEKVFPYFELDSNGKLSLSKPLDEIVNEFGYNQEFKVRVENLLIENEAVQNNKNIAPRIHVSDWKVYFTYDDVMATLFAAAQIGPAAIVAALTALGSVYPGVGTVIGAVIGLIGGGTIVYYVLQAAANQQGLYIGIDWNGAFPNPAIGTW